MPNVWKGRDRCTCSKGPEAQEKGEVWRGKNFFSSAFLALKRRHIHSRSLWNISVTPPERSAQAFSLLWGKGYVVKNYISTFSIYWLSSRPKNWVIYVWKFKKVQVIYEVLKWTGIIWDFPGRWKVFLRGYILGGKYQDCKNLTEF